MRIVKAALAVFLCAGGTAGEAVAQEAETAARLHEVHGSWQLACAAAAKKDSADAASSTGGETKPPCAIAQVQLEEKTRKLVVSVEFRLDDAATPDR
ncbi:invasion associated locus B family protein, partial [Pseudomonas fluorescens]